MNRTPRGASEVIAVADNSNALALTLDARPNEGVLGLIENPVGCQTQRHCLQITSDVVGNSSPIRASNARPLSRKIKKGVRIVAIPEG